MTDAGSDESTARLADEYPSPAPSHPLHLPPYQSPTATSLPNAAQSGVGVRPVEPRLAPAPSTEHASVQAPAIGVAPDRPARVSVPAPTTGMATSLPGHMMAIGVGVQPHIDLEEVAVNSARAQSAAGHQGVSMMTDPTYAHAHQHGTGSGVVSRTASGTNTPIAASGLIGDHGEETMADTLANMQDEADFETGSDGGFDPYQTHDTLAMTHTQKAELSHHDSNHATNGSINATTDLHVNPTPSTRQTKPGRALSTFYTPTPQPGRLPSSVGLSHAEQITILREAFLRNPLPNRHEMQELADKTGRPAGKVREYFRQRRSKGRGIEMLEELEEPARAAGWLQQVFRAAPPTACIPQLSLYASYKTRFDPYSQHSPLLGGQELIQMALATFPGCEMAKDEGEYVLRGLGERDQAGALGPPSDGRLEHELKGDAVRGSQSLAEGEVNVGHAASADHREDGGSGETLKDALDRMQSAATAAAYTADMPDGQALASHQPHAPDIARDGVQTLDGLAEPLRATSWLLHQYDEAAHAHLGGDIGGTSLGQTVHHAHPRPDSAFVDTPTESLHPATADTPFLAAGPSTLHTPHAHPAQVESAITQADLYTAYMDRFSHTQPAPRDDHPSTFPSADDENETSNGIVASVSHERSMRVLNPVELLQLVRITFPSCEPAVDEAGRFVVRGLERREGVRDPKRGEMFPFALTTEPNPSDPLHPLTSLLKRKLEGSAGGPSSDEAGSAKRQRIGGAGVNVGVAGDLAIEDRQLLEGLERFRHSKLGEQVRDVCISQ